MSADCRLLACPCPACWKHNRHSPGREASGPQSGASSSSCPAARLSRTRLISSRRRRWSFEAEFKPIRTNVPGIEISEMFPLLAQQADKYAIIRSVTHDSNIHTVGAHAMLTGNPYPKAANGEISASPADFPHYGSVLTYLQRGKLRAPNFVALPQKNANTDGTVWPGQGGGFLGARYDPLQVTADYEKHRPDLKSYENCRFHTPSLTLPEGITPERFNARRKLLAAMERNMRATEHDASQGLLDHYREKAFDLLSSTENAARVQYRGRIGADPGTVMAGTCSGRAVSWRVGWLRRAFPL